MSNAQYFLSPTVHWCIVEHQCIILDVENDRYLQAPASAFISLLSYISHAPSSADARSPQCIPTDLTEIAEDLLAVGVLSRTPSNAPRLESAQLPRAARLISHAIAPRAPAAALRSLPRFLIACAMADSLLRSSSFGEILSRIHARKSFDTCHKPIEVPQTTIELAQIFHQLRPFYPRDYLCLFDSLALLEFLDHWNIHPDLVFGVMADPFLAHCWIQLDDTVLVDSITFGSRWFTPILVL